MEPPVNSGGDSRTASCLLWKWSGPPGEDGSRVWLSCLPKAVFYDTVAWGLLLGGVGTRIVQTVPDPVNHGPALIACF